LKRNGWGKCLAILLHNTKLGFATGWLRAILVAAVLPGFLGARRRIFRQVGFRTSRGEQALESHPFARFLCIYGEHIANRDFDGMGDAAEACGKSDPFIVHVHVTYRARAHVQYDLTVLDIALGHTGTCIDANREIGSQAAVNAPLIKGA